MATAGGFGLAKTRSTLKNRKRLSRKIIRAFSVFTLLGGSALSLHASFGLKKNILGSKKPNTQAVNADTAIDLASTTRSRHNLNPLHTDTSTIWTEGNSVSTASDTEYTRQLSDESLRESDDGSDDEVTLVDSLSTHTDNKSLDYSQSSDDRDARDDTYSLYISDDALSADESLSVGGSDEHPPVTEAVECTDNLVDEDFDDGSSECFALMTKQERTLLKAKREKLTKIIEEIESEKYTQRCLEHHKISIEDDYFRFNSRPEDKPCTHYTESYYIDPSNHFFILKAILYNTEETTPKITFWVIKENALSDSRQMRSDLQKIIASHLSFVRQDKKSSRFKKFNNEDILIPLEVYITDSLEATYDNGILTSINRSLDSMPPGAGVWLSSCSGAAAGSSDDGRSYAGAGTGAGALAGATATDQAQTHTWSMNADLTWSMNADPTDSFNQNSGADLKEIDLPLTRYLRYKRTFNPKKNTWTHSITRTFGDKSPLCSWTSPTAFQVIRPEILAAKILDSIRSPSLSPTSKKLEIASKILQFMPSTLPPLPTSASLVLRSVLKNVSDMYKSFQKIYTDISIHRNDKQAQVKQILDSLLDDKEQLSLILHAPAVLSILSKQPTSETLPDAPKQRLVALIESLRSFTKINSTTSNTKAILTLYQTHKHRIKKTACTKAPQRSFADSLNEAAAKLTMQWNNIKPSYRTSLLTQLNAIFTDPKAKTLASPDQKALADYFTHALPKASRTLPTWQTLTQAALEVYVRTPLTLAFQTYCRSLHSTTGIEKELLPLLEPLFAHLLRCTQSHSLAEFIASVTSLIESFNKTIADNADRFYAIFPPKLKEAIAMNESNRLQEIKNHCYCIVAEKIHAALKPQSDRSGLSIFLNERKDSIIRAIQRNQLAEYLLDKIDICTTYLKTKTTSKQSNGLVLCTLQTFGFIKTPIAEAFISTIMRNISNEQTKTSMQVLKKHLIPLYNECVPIINHFIKIIEGRAQQLPITDMQEFMSVVQDALWYFND
ncbi:MAG: hypothetical protein WCJ17_01010 [bacterium]